MNGEKQVILVTGCSGRIGMRVAEKFQNAPFQVIGLDIVPPPHQYPNFDFIHTDLTSDESVQNAIKTVRQKYGDRISSVIHLAAYYNFSGGKWEMYQKITVDGTARLLRAVQQCQTEQFLFSSTMLVHQPCGIHQKINEDWPMEASWEYPKSKILTEKMMIENHNGVPIVIFRIAGCYDDECHSIPISNQIQRIYEKDFTAYMFPGNLKHGASFLHLDDLADAIWLAVNKRKNLPNEFIALVGEEETMSYDAIQRQISFLLYRKEMRTLSVPKWFAKLGAAILDKISKNAFIKPWMIDLADQNYILDISRIKKTLDWYPKRSLRSTLPLMIAFLKKDPVSFYKANGLKMPNWLCKRLKEECKSCEK